MIILCGIKHCGKSTLGRLLAQHHNVQFIDSDTELTLCYKLEHKSNLNCREIYQKHGEEFFRRLEAKVIEVLLEKSGNCVLSLGGGAASNPYLDKSKFRLAETIIWLNIDESIAFKRIEKNGLPPFLASSPNPFDTFVKQNITRKLDFASIANIEYKIDRELPIEIAVKQIETLIAGK